MKHTRSSNFNAQDDNVQLVAICANFFVFILTFFPAVYCLHKARTHTYTHCTEKHLPEVMWSRE